VLPLIAVLQRLGLPVSSSGFRVTRRVAPFRSDGCMTGSAERGSSHRGLALFKLSSSPVRSLRLSVSATGFGNFHQRRARLCVTQCGPAGSLSPQPGSSVLESERCAPWALFARGAQSPSSGRIPAPFRGTPYPRAVTPRPQLLTPSNTSRVSRVAWLRLAVTAKTYPPFLDLAADPRRRGSASQPSKSPGTEGVSSSHCASRTHSAWVTRGRGPFREGRHRIHNWPRQGASAQSPWTAKAALPFNGPLVLRGPATLALTAPCALRSLRVTRRDHMRTWTVCSLSLDQTSRRATPATRFLVRPQRDFCPRIPSGWASPMYRTPRTPYDQSAQTHPRPQRKLRGAVQCARWLHWHPSLAPLESRRWQR
jgi:hypothetical protein